MSKKRREKRKAWKAYRKKLKKAHKRQKDAAKKEPDSLDLMIDPARRRS